MELGYKKPKINLSSRENDIGSTERYIKKDNSFKSHTSLIDQTRNKSISNITKKTHEINKIYTNEKSSNFDQKKYVLYLKHKTILILS